MDMYVSDCFRIDDLLDFSNKDLTTSSSSSTDSHHHHHQQIPPPQNPFHHHHYQSSSDTFSNFPCAPSTEFTADLCVPSDDVAELEWLSQFVDDSFHEFPANEMLGSSLQSDTSFPSEARSKRSRLPAPEAPITGKPRAKTAANRASSSLGEGGVRRCTHCASEKTPQWRTGPLGPKTLCNACGVRFKSGRLVPEYRPASSPTFVLTQHSNSHRKVLELRRQKELMKQQQQQLQQQQEQCYRHRHDFEVC